MAKAEPSDKLRGIPSVNAVFLVGAMPLFFGAFLCDWAYLATYEVQWKNFASWLIAGGLVFTGMALIWAIIDAVRGARWHPVAGWIGAGLMAAVFVLGFINALVHAKDAWAAMPAGLILSLIVLALTLVAIGASFGRIDKRCAA